jgi:uncharacterized membrane protein
MTKQEMWVLFVFLTLVVTGLVAKAWLRTRPPEPLAPLPQSVESNPR